MCAEAQDTVSTALDMPLSLLPVKTGELAGIHTGFGESAGIQTSNFPIRIGAGLMEETSDNNYAQRRAALPQKRGTCENFAPQA
jgi:hypothetical protein